MEGNLRDHANERERPALKPILQALAVAMVGSLGLLASVGATTANGQTSQVITPATANTVLTAVSGWGQESDRRRAREAGFIYHLVKPVDIEQLEKIIGTEAHHAHSH